MVRVCVEGNIGSGKSEALDALRLAFPNVAVFPEPVDQWGELLSLYYALPAEWALPFSLKVLLSFCEPAKVEDCIVERSPLASRHVFTQLLFNENVLNCHEWELFKEYHDVLAWKPDVIFYVDTPVDTCMARIQERGRECEKTIEAAYLKRVEFQYANMLRFADVPVVRFDGGVSKEDLHAAMVLEASKHFPKV